MLNDCPECEGQYHGKRCRCGYEIEIRPLRETSSNEPLPITSPEVKEAMRELLAGFKIPEPKPKHEKPDPMPVKREPRDQEYFRKLGWNV